ncbi:MAG: hypothetical protein MJ088_06365 [Clostridia bacterium]|nr:hypothetical protein [Clostridia bacterium]
MSNVKLLYVGIGGYGVTNLDRFLSGELEGCEIAGVVDVKPETTWFYNRRTPPTWRSSPPRSSSTRRRAFTA